MAADVAFGPIEKTETQGVPDDPFNMAGKTINVSNVGQYVELIINGESIPTVFVYDSSTGDYQSGDYTLSLVVHGTLTKKSSTEPIAAPDDDTETFTATVQPPA